MKKTLRLIALFLLVSQVLVSCGEGEKPDTTDADTSTDGESLNIRYLRRAKKSLQKCTLKK